MKPHPTSIENLPVNDLGDPNDDGCILGTAGHDEDPNATTDCDHESDSAGNVQTPEDAHGLPGYPRDIEDDEEHSIPLKRPRGAEPETGIETPEQDNDSVD